MKIDAVNEITDPKLGVPNPSCQCSTCGAKDTKKCEGAVRQVIQKLYLLMISCYLYFLEYAKL